MSSLRTQGPITTGRCYCKGRPTAVSPRRPRRMGPCVRRHDSLGAAGKAASRIHIFTCQTARCVQTQLHDPAACMREFYLERPALRNQRAQGMPGARSARSLACRKNTRVSHHGHTGSPGIPCAMVLTVSFVLSPVTGLVCHRHRRSLLRRLERQRRGVRTTRLRRPLQAPFVYSAKVSTASRLTFVTIARRPSEKAGPNRNIPVSTCPSN
jgi:hypothetical protein